MNPLCSLSFSGQTRPRIWDAKVAIAYYAVAAVGLSVTVNFGLVTVLKDFDPTLGKAAAVGVAAVAAALVAWFVATRLLRIGGG